MLSQIWHGPTVIISLSIKYPQNLGVRVDFLGYSD